MILKIKNVKSAHVEMLRNWRKVTVPSVWTWLKGAALVNVTGGLLDSDGAMVNVPGKRFGGSSEEVSGMWFGPRLGKRDKRSAHMPLTVFTVRGKLAFCPETKCRVLFTVYK